MKILNLRVLSDEVDEFSRVYEVESGMSLLGLHDFICRDLEYDLSNFSSFFQSNANWDKLQEYTLVDMNDEEEGTISLSMDGTTAGELLQNRKDHLIFMFDIFAARSLFIELECIADPQPAVRYPRVVSSEGDAPHQLEADSMMSENSPFNDIMEDFMDFAGDDDSFADEY